MLLTRIHFGIIVNLNKPVRVRVWLMGSQSLVQPLEKDAIQHQLKCLNLARKTQGLCVGNAWVPWDGFAGF